MDIYIYNIARFIRFLKLSKEKVEYGDYFDHDRTFAHKFSKEEVENELREGGFHLVYYSEKGYPHAIGKAK